MLLMLSIFLGIIGDNKCAPMDPKNIDNIDNINKTRVLSTF